MSSSHLNHGWTSILEPYSGAWQLNDELCVQDVMRNPTIYACHTLIVNDIGKLAPRIVAKTSDGIWEEVANRYAGLLRKPNRYQNHIQFKQWWVSSKLRCGNTYVLKERDRAGNVVALYILNPDRVVPLVTEDGAVYYELDQDELNGQRALNVTVPASEIIHDRMNCIYHPLVGVAPLYAAAIVAGIGLKIQDNMAYFFKNQSTPSGILVAPGAITKENASEVKASWEANYSGSNTGKVAVMGHGLKYEPIGHNAVDSQLVQSLEWSDERICSVYHVPAYKVGVGNAPSYNNIEALDRAYYSECLQSPIEEMEACLDEGLGFDGFTIGVELDLYGLLRMDSKTQMETLKSGVDGSILTINGARKQLNLPPLEGGDTVYMQQQDFPLDQVQNNSLALMASNDEPSDSPAAAPEVAAVRGNVQQEALNGAQVTALQEIIMAVSDGRLDAESARAMIAAAFPLIEDDQIAQMVENAKNTVPPVEETPEQAEQNIERKIESIVQKMMDKSSEDDGLSDLLEGLRSLEPVEVMNA